MITILLACRSPQGGNDNSHLKDLLASLQNASSHEAYEVLIKFDNDDKGLDDLIAIVTHAKEKGREIISPDDGSPQGFLPGQSIRYIVTPRGMGYGDLHKAYLDLLRIATPRTRMYWVLSDDVILLGNKWDKYLELAADKYPDEMFVLCPMFLCNYHTQGDRDALTMCDNYPVWSADFVKAVGGFGYTFSTDGWTNLILRRLALIYGIDRRVLCVQVNLQRRTGKADEVGSERWNGIRKETHDLMLTPQVQSLIDGQARAIAGYMQMAVTKKEVA